MTVTAKKKKMTPTRRLASLPFVGIWAGAHALAWLTIFLLWEHSYWLQRIDDGAFALMLGLYVGGIVTVMQKGLMRYNFGVRLRGWIRVSLVMWAVGGFTFYTVGDVLNVSDETGLIFVAFFLPPVIAQTLILRRSARHAFLWVLAGAVSAVVFGGVYAQLQYSPMGEGFALMTAGAAQGAVTALTLLWLFYTPST